MKADSTKRATHPAKRIRRYLKKQYQKALRLNYPVKPLEVPGDVSPWEMLRAVIGQYYEREAEQCARIRQAQDRAKSALQGVEDLKAKASIAKAAYDSIEGAYEKACTRIEKLVNERAQVYDKLISIHEASGEDTALTSFAETLARYYEVCTGHKPYNTANAEGITLEVCAVLRELDLNSDFAKEIPFISGLICGANIEENRKRKLLQSIGRINNLYYALSLNAESALLLCSLAEEAAKAIGEEKIMINPALTMEGK